MTEKWYSDPGHFWKFRAILEIDRKGKRRLDYVPDRGGFEEGQRTPEHLEFIREITKSKEFDAWLQTQRGNSNDKYVIDRDGMHFRSTPNASHGYLYMYAWGD